MLTQLVVWLNAMANLCAAILLWPIAVLPGWLSATLVAVVTGVLMLVAFKYTSNQTAIKRVRNHLKANLLALSLFKDNVGVSLRAQGRILLGAGRLMLLSIWPLLVMLVPMCVLLAQLALWYQARPVRVGEEAVVTVHLTHRDSDELPNVQLAQSSAFVSTVGPVRVPQKHMICWNVRPSAAGSHHLAFHIDGRTFDKELAVGDGFMPTSLSRPGWSWYAAMLHPRERPFPVDSPVQSITVDYPERLSWCSGSDWWVLYWFIVSLAAAFIARPLLKVAI